MVSIAVVNAKGGCGKTTTAMMLAQMGWEAGYSTRVVDLDPQESALSWAKEAQDMGDSLAFPVEVLDSSQLGREWEEDIVFLDTPPIIPDVIDAAVDVADFVIIVAMPEPAVTYQALRIIPSVGHRNYAVLLVRVTAGRLLLEETLQVFHDAEVPLFRGYISDREEIKRRWGRSLGGLRPGAHGYKSVFAQLFNDK
jgi:hypothetical protein